MGRVVPLADGLVQVVLRESLAVWRGDRFVLRDAAATRTLGGGTILDPLPPQRYRRSEQRLAVLRALGRPTVAAQLASLVDVSVEGVDVRSFARAGNVPDASAIAAETRAVHVTTPHGEFLLSQPVWEAHGNAAVLALEKFHRAHSDLLGLDRARLRRMALPKLDDALFRALVDALVKGGRVRESGGILHLPTHDNALSASERALVEEAMPYLVEGRFDPPWVRDLARDLRKPEEQLRSALVRAAKRGELYQVVHDLFYHPATLGELARCVSDLEREHGAIAAATFRDSTGLGRKRAIQILEYFDRIGYTRRVRDRRMVREGSPLAASRPS
jgi:selenocysteine-specific elongation factor